MSNAQVAAAVSALVGLAVLALAQKMNVLWVTKPVGEPQT
jgi:hypothetical protein